MSSQMINFFKELSQFFHKENDLSDVTVSLCNSHEEFRQFFLEFFFGNNIDVSKVTSIEREVYAEKQKDSRVDIAIYCEGQEKPSYIIEVKKGDQNHHFGQYEGAFDVDQSHFGYITNYFCVEGIEKGYDVKTWRQFKEYLDKSKLNEDNIVQGYTEYLKHVCNIDVYTEPVQLHKYFNEDAFKYMVQSIVEYNACNHYQTKLHGKYQSKPYYGFFYGKNGIDQKQGGYLIAGIKQEESPAIILAIHARDKQEKYALESILKDGEYFVKPSKREYLVADSNVCFYLNDTYLKQFKEAKSFKEQESILSNFINEVIELLLPAI